MTREDHVNESPLRFLGDRAAVGEAVAKVCGVPLVRGVDGGPKAGDRILIDVTLDPSRHPGLPGGHALAACRAWKQVRGVSVGVLVPQGDRFTPEIARFCLADGVVEVAPDGSITDAAELRRWVAGRTRHTERDAVLQRLAAADSERSLSALERMLERQESDQQQWVAAHLTDAETGLFCAPFAGFKLDEECKRATRFHQPLGLLLVDVGELPNAGPTRAALLADLAGVFLDQCRDIDTLARFTPTVFLFLLPGTGVDGAATLARRILPAIAERLAADASGAAHAHPRAGIAVMPSARIRRSADLLRAAEAALASAASQSDHVGQSSE